MSKKEKTYEEIEQEILENPQFGATVEERKSRLEYAYIWTIPFSALGFLNLIGSFSGHQFFFYTGLGLPLLAIFLIAKFDGLVKWFVNVFKKPYPQVGFIFVLGLGSMGAISDNYCIEDRTNMWLPAALVAVFVLLIWWYSVYFFKAKHLKSQQHKFLWFMLPLSFAYGCAFIVCLNGLFDASKVLTYKVEILEKHTYRSNKSRNYDFLVTDWTKNYASRAISVHGNLFYAKEQNDFIHIETHSGLLKIPWFQIREQVYLDNN